MTTTNNTEYLKREVDFVFAVFTEANEHIRATDEKNILIAGSFIALVSVVIAIFIDKMNQVSWAYFAFASFTLTVGFCVLMLQFWYREWKEHYCEICKSITLKFEIEDEVLPFWIRKCETKGFSTDKLLIAMTALINISLIFCSIYLLWNLLKWPVAPKLLIVACLLTIYLLMVIVTKKKLINRRRSLTA